MSEKKFATVTRKVKLLDSQVMDYSVKLQKDELDCKIHANAITKKAMAHTWTPCNETQLSPDWGTSKKIVKFSNFFSFFNKWVSGLVCIKELFLKMEVTTCISRILHTCMTDLGWFPRKQENSARIHGDIFQQMHMNQRRSLPTSRTHTSWWHEDGSHKFPTLVSTVQYEPL
jgi:hypothetical protein